jgi:putative tryptophan/tyrosine transport system substrate-binding protein
MRRRELVRLLGGAVISWPLAARAQQKRVPVIGYLDSDSAARADSAALVAAFHEGLSETGYVEGQNVAIEYRWAEGRYDRLPAMAADLVGRKVDLIVASGGLLSTLAAKSATSTIPIVFTGVSDPVAAGLVASLARPGGNLTGSSPFSLELMPKRLELLTELVPQARTITLLANPNDPNTERVLPIVQEAARTKGVQLSILKASTESEIDSAFASLVQTQAGALVVPTEPFFNSRRAQLLALASRHAIPAIYGWREFAVAGGLISYGTSLIGMRRQAGVYAGKILKGAKPADLPVQQPTRFELVVNLKTAKALGLTVPPSILARADEVIEYVATIRKAIPELGVSVVPAGSYPSLKADYKTIGLYNFGVASKDLPDDLVYAIVKAFYANHDRTVKAVPSAREGVVENLKRNTLIPYHPGAVRYYREIGIDIPANLVPTN